MWDVTKVHPCTLQLHFKQFIYDAGAAKLWTLNKWALLLILTAILIFLYFTAPQCSSSYSGTFSRLHHYHTNIIAKIIYLTLVKMVKMVCPATFQQKQQLSLNLTAATHRRWWKRARCSDSLPRPSYKNRRNHVRVIGNIKRNVLLPTWCDRHVILSHYFGSWNPASL